MNEWRQVNGSYIPEPISIYNNEFVILTKNVQQTGETIWSWDEYIMPKDQYDFYVTIIDIILNNRLETKNETEE